MAMKPLDGTFAENALRHEVAGINVDGGRIEGERPDTTRGAGGQHGITGPRGAQGRIVDDGKGRWPANVILDEDAAALLDKQSGVSKARPTQGHPTQTDCPTGNFVSSKVSMEASMMMRVVRPGSSMWRRRRRVSAANTTPTRP